MIFRLTPLTSAAKLIKKSVSQELCNADLIIDALYEFFQRMFSTNMNVVIYLTGPYVERSENQGVPVHCGRRVWRNRILILLFFWLRTQFSMYKNTLDILEVLLSC